MLALINEYTLEVLFSMFNVLVPHFNSFFLKWQSSLLPFLHCRSQSISQKGANVWPVWTSWIAKYCVSHTICISWTKNKINKGLLLINCQMIQPFNNIMPLCVLMKYPLYAFYSILIFFMCVCTCGWWKETHKHKSFDDSYFVKVCLTKAC